MSVAPLQQLLSCATPCAGIQGTAAGMEQCCTAAEGTALAAAGLVWHGAAAGAATSGAADETAATSRACASCAAASFRACASCAAARFRAGASCAAAGAASSCHPAGAAHASAAAAPGAPVHAQLWPPPCAGHARFPAQFSEAGRAAAELQLGPGPATRERLWPAAGRAGDVREPASLWRCSHHWCWGWQRWGRPCNHR